MAIRIGSQLVEQGTTKETTKMPRILFHNREKSHYVMQCKYLAI